MSRYPLALAALLVVFAAAPSAGQDSIDEQCILDPNIAPCAQSRARRLSREYDVPTIETHLERGDAVVRVFFIDGNGHNQVLISFVRARGHDPTVFVHFPSSGGRRTIPPLQAPLPQANWDEAVFRAIYAEREFASFEPDPSDQLICLHPWTYAFESSEPAREGSVESARTRRRIINSCEDAPLILFASDILRLTMPLFPACDALDSRRYGLDARRLFACRVLSGDRLAAASIVNLAAAFERVRDSGDLVLLEDLFSAEASVDWAGRHPEGQDPDQFWIARAVEDQVTSFDIQTAEGLSPDRVRITGYLGRLADGERGAVSYSAPFEQIWVQEMIVSATVGRWTAQRPD